MVNTPEKKSVNGNNDTKEPLRTSPDKPKTTEVDKKLLELEDPLCSPNNIHKITFQDVTTAAFLIKDGVEYTPCPVIAIRDSSQSICLKNVSSLVEITIVGTVGDVNLSEKGVSAVHWKVRKTDDPSLKVSVCVT